MFVRIPPLHSSQPAMIEVNEPKDPAKGYYGKGVQEIGHCRGTG